MFGYNPASCCEDSQDMEACDTGVIVMTEVDRIWYLRRSDGEGSVGPFSTEQLRDQWEKGLLEETAEGWKEGMPDWRALAEIEPFASTPRVPTDAPDIIRFSCECGNQIVMSAKFIGRLAKCKVCGRTVTVHDPSETPEPEPKKHKRREKEAEEGRPMWVIPAIAAAALVIVAVVITYFVVSGSAKEGPVATGPQDRGSRISRARDELLDDNVLEPKEKVRPADRPIDEPRPARDEEAERPAGVEETPQDTRHTLADTSDHAEDTARAEPIPTVEQATSAGESDDRPERTNGGADDKAVHKLAREFFQAFRTKDPTPLERLTELLADDCIVVPATGGLIEGKEANIEAFKEAIAKKAQRFRELHATYEIRWQRVFADSAVTCGELSERGSLRAGARPSSEVLWATLVFERADGQWRIVAVHYTPVVRRKAPAG